MRLDDRTLGLGSHTGRSPLSTSSSRGRSHAEPRHDLVGPNKRPFMRPIFDPFLTESGPPRHRDEPLTFGWREALT